MSSSEKELLNPHGKCFAGQGIEVEIGIFNEKNQYGLNDVLLKITGGPAYDAGIDGKVIKYAAVPGGTGCDFKYENAGKMVTRMITRSSWGSWSFFQVFLNENSYYIYPKHEKSKSVLPMHLYSQYQTSLGKE